MLRELSWLDDGSVPLIRRRFGHLVISRIRRLQHTITWSKLRREITALLHGILVRNGTGTVLIGLRLACEADGVGALVWAAAVNVVNRIAKAVAESVFILASFQSLPKGRPRGTFGSHERQGAPERTGGPGVGDGSTGMRTRRCETLKKQ